MSFHHWRFREAPSGVSADLPELAHAARGRLSFAKDGAAQVREGSCERFTFMGSREGAGSSGG